MDALFVLGVIVTTSAMAYLVGRRGGLGREALGPAFGRLLEFAGLAVVFLVVNILAGAVGVLLLRAVTGRFVSMYVNTDTTILLLSMAQAVVVQWWRAETERTRE